MVQHGRFYFKQTASGNLLGEYSNENSKANATESCTILCEHNSSKDKFVGRYQTTWFEQEPVGTILDIHIVSNNIFKLTWSNGGKATFQGEGFIVDDILVGTYWSV